MSGTGTGRNVTPGTGTGGRAGAGAGTGGRAGAGGTLPDNAALTNWLTLVNHNREDAPLRLALEQNGITMLQSVLILNPRTDVEGMEYRQVDENGDETGPKIKLMLAYKTLLQQVIALHHATKPANRGDTEYDWGGLSADLWGEWTRSIFDQDLSREEQRARYRRFVGLQTRRRTRGQALGPTRGEHQLLLTNQDLWSCSRNRSGVIETSSRPSRKTGSGTPSSER